jgi:class 3 adenylate cyclase
MSSLPTGTVTFLFTDIEGSTRLIQYLGDRYAQVLTEYRRFLRHAFQERGGVTVDTQGDAYKVTRLPQSAFLLFNGRRASIIAEVCIMIIEMRTYKTKPGKRS